MAYRIHYEKEQDYISVVIDGDLELSTLHNLASDVSKLIEKHGCSRILNDMRKAQLSKGFLDVYKMPKIASASGVQAKYKRALVVREGSTDFHFMETVFLNQGHNVQMFTDIDEAKSWLFDDQGED